MSPASIAVVGASPRGNRGSVILHNLQRFGFAGRLYAVHPSAREIDGVPCYPSLAALPEVPEFVAVALGAAKAVDVVREAAALGVKAALVIASGFGEGSQAGSDLQAELVHIARQAGMPVCGPNCYGILNLHAGAAPYSGSVVQPLTRGNVGFVTQSGAVTHSIQDATVGRGLAVSYFITTGNEAVVELSEYVHWLVEDPQTDIIVTFIEGLKNPVRFAAVARRALLRGKPIIALKVGRSALGQRAALAHTGSIAGSDAIIDGLFEQCGVIRVNDLEELIETTLLFTAARRPQGQGFAVAALSGGLTTLVADLAEDIGLSLPAPAAETTARLREVLPPFGTATNPQDCTGAMAEDPEILGGVARAYLADPEVDAFAYAFNVPMGSEGQEELYRTHGRILAQVAAQAEKPVLAFAAVAGKVDPEIVGPLGQAGVPFLVGARESLLAMRRWTGYWARHRRASEASALPRAAGRGLDPVPPGSPAVLTERRAAQVLQQYGIGFVRTEACATADEAVAAARRIGLPVALKVDSPDILHKTEAGGVRLDLRTEDEVREAFRAVTEAARRHDPRARIDGVLVQAMAGSGVEVLLGLTRDPQFGPQVAVGAGGILVELVRQVAFRPVPLSRADAEALVDRPSLSALLAGFRGRGPADRGALIEAILALSDLASDLGDRLREVDLNPVLVLPEGQGVCAVDALIVLEGGDSRIEPR